MTETATETTAPTPERLTGWFVAMLAVTVLTAPFTLIGPLVALATPLRSSRRKMTLLWVTAVALLALVVALALFADSDLWPSWLMFDSEEDA